MAILTRTSQVHEETDRLNRLVRDGDLALRELKAKHDAQTRLGANEQVTKLLGELQSAATGSIKIREALAAFMSNLDADVKILMAAIK